jgi:hypothetical protein
MKTTTRLLTIALILVILNSQLSTLFAQSTVVTYQGRVTSHGTNFTGAGQFKFALVTSTNTSVQATATANPPVSGFITTINVTSGGAGYTASPAVSITGGGGSGATATATVSGGAVIGITVNTAGSGYSSTPTVTIDAPPPNVLYTSYWSNDGSSSAGNQPVSVVTTPVNGGLFIVGLGDTTLPNMMALSPTLFLQTNLQLRIWFNNGIDGFAALSPVQNLSAAPYAANAAVATSVSAANITGTLAAAQLPAIVVTNGASGVNFSGTFSGNGAGVTNVSIVTLNTYGSITWGNFLLSSSPAVGQEPVSVTAADVDGDGKVDLISANLRDGTITVLINNGSGGFGYSATYNVGLDPVLVTAADVNGDGLVDLISANEFGNRLIVLTNNGGGGFVSNATYNVGNQPFSVAAADVNGDGWVDLICANYKDDTLTVLTNNRSGGFGSSAIYNVGNGPRSVVAADFNGDGKVDLICANYDTNTITVLTNNGSGGFSSSATSIVGNGPISLTVADVNGDGKADLICANNRDDTLKVLTFNNRGTASRVATYSVGNGPVSVTTADVNGDGKVDLICANINDSTLTVLTNSLDQSKTGLDFGFYATYQVGSGPISVTAADVNGDGKLDLICANRIDNTLTVLVNSAAFEGEFVGDGSRLTALNASQLAYGTVPGAALSGADGSGLVNLNAAQLAGTVADARLSANVALRNSANTFNGNQTVVGGSVGIGTTSPANKLDVQGAADFTGNVGIGTTNPGPNNLQINPTFESANGYGLVVCRTNYGANFQLNSVAGQNGIGLAVDNVANGDSYTSMLLIRNNMGGAGQTLMNVRADGTALFSGSVGIGTATPTKGSLEIDAANGSQPGFNQTGFLDASGASSGSVGAGGFVSIWAAGWVFATEFAAFSDERIKNVVAQSDSAADLKTLLGIKVTDFTYKDTIAKGNAPQKKVIAQQVEQVYPQAVSKSTDVVPDIYRKATLKDGWVHLATDLKVGDRVKLIGEKEKGVYPVLEIRDGAFRTDFKPSTEQVFVYGREVKDFRTVDYEAIAMLNVSATQELAHQLKAQQEELTGLQVNLKQALTDKEALLKRLSDLEARDQAREERLVRMERALDKGSDRASYVSLKRP